MTRSPCDGERFSRPVTIPRVSRSSPPCTTLSLQELSRLARLNPRPGVVSTGRIVQLLASSDHADATIVSMSSASDRRAVREPMSWSIASTDRLMGV